MSDIMAKTATPKTAAQKAENTGKGVKLENKPAAAVKAENNPVAAKPEDKPLATKPENKGGDMKNMLVWGSIGILLLVVLLAVIAVFIGGFIPKPTADYTDYSKQTTQQDTVNADGRIECTTAKCFIDAANNCQYAIFDLTDDVGTFAFEEKDCMLTKTVMELNGKESQEMKKLLEYKRVVCTYEKGNFDERLLWTLTQGIDNCTGALKETIGQLMIFIGDEK